MNIRTAAGGTSFLQHVSNIIDPRRAPAPVHRNSLPAGSCEHRVWSPTSREAVTKVQRAAQRYERTHRQKGRRNGPLGYVALEVLALLANIVSYKTGRLEPSLEYICNRLCRSKDAVVRALNALRRHGFLDWLRRYAPTDADGRAPQIRQVSNAYRLMIPKTALALLGRWAGKPDLPDDDQDSRAERASIEHDHAASLDLSCFASFKVGNSDLGKALAMLGKSISLRESAKQTEYQSKI